MAKSFEEIQEQAQQELREAGEELIEMWRRREEECREVAERAKRYEQLAQYCQKMANEVQSAINSGAYSKLSEEAKADYS